MCLVDLRVRLVGCWGGERWEGVADRPCRRLGWRICLLRFRLGSSGAISCQHWRFEVRVDFVRTFETSFLEVSALESRL